MEEKINVTVEVMDGSTPVQILEFDDELAVLDYCKLLALETKTKVRFSANGGRHGVILEPPVINA